MTKRWWGLIPAVFVLAGALVLGGGVGAQNSNVPEDELGMVAELHTGSCANFDTGVAFPIGSLTRTGAQVLGSSSTSDTGFGSLGNGLVGASDTTPVWTARDTIDAAPADLFGGSQGYALVVGEQGSTGTVAACGDLGGVVANGQIAVALLPINSTPSGLLTGIAVFSQPNRLRVITDEEATATAEVGGTIREQTEVTVYVFRLAAATTPATGVASPQPASPTAEPTEVPTEVPTVAATATGASTAEPTVSGTSTPTEEATTAATATTAAESTATSVP